MKNAMIRKIISSLFIVVCSLSLAACGGGGGSGGGNTTISDQNDDNNSSVQVTIPASLQNLDLSVSSPSGTNAAVAEDGTTDFVLPTDTELISLIDSFENIIYLAISTGSDDQLELNAMSTAVSMVAIHPIVASFLVEHETEILDHLQTIRNLSQTYQLADLIQSRINNNHMTWATVDAEMTSILVAACEAALIALAPPTIAPLNFVTLDLERERSGVTLSYVKQQPGSVYSVTIDNTFKRYIFIDIESEPWNSFLLEPNKKKSFSLDASRFKGLSTEDSVQEGTSKIAVYGPGIKSGGTVNLSDLVTDIKFIEPTTMTAVYELGFPMLKLIVGKKQQSDEDCLAAAMKPDSPHFQKILHNIKMNNTWLNRVRNDDYLGAGSEIALIMVNGYLDVLKENTFSCALDAVARNLNFFGQLKTAYDIVNTGVSFGNLMIAINNSRTKEEFLLENILTLKTHAYNREGKVTDTFDFFTSFLQKDQGHDVYSSTYHEGAKFFWKVEKNIHGEWSLLKDVVTDTNELVYRFYDEDMNATSNAGEFKVTATVVDADGAQGTAFEFINVTPIAFDCTSKGWQQALGWFRDGEKCQYSAYMGQQEMTGYVHAYGEDYFDFVEPQFTEQLGEIDWKDAANGRFSYTPPPKFTGQDSFTFIALTSSGLESNVAKILIDVVPPGLERVSPYLQIGKPNEPLCAPLQVRVVDDKGAPLSGVEVHWSVSNSMDSISPEISISGADGIAEANWTLGETCASHSAIATIVGHEGKVVTQQSFIASLGQYHAQTWGIGYGNLTINTSGLFSVNINFSYGAEIEDSIYMEEDFGYLCMPDPDKLYSASIFFSTQAYSSGHGLLDIRRCGRTLFHYEESLGLTEEPQERSYDFIFDGY